MQIHNTTMTPALGSVKFQAGMNRRNFLGGATVGTFLAPLGLRADEKKDQPQPPRKYTHAKYSGTLAKEWVLTLIESDNSNEKGKKFVLIGDPPAMTTKINDYLVKTLKDDKGSSYTVSGIPHIDNGTLLVGDRDPKKDISGFFVKNPPPPKK